jgi:hypothetical protein
MHNLTIHETFAFNRMTEFFAHHGIDAVFEDDHGLLWFIVRNSFIAPPGMKQTLDQARELVKSLEKKKMLERRVSHADAPDMLSLVENN